MSYGWRLWLLGLVGGVPTVPVREWLLQASHAIFVDSQAEIGSQVFGVLYKSGKRNHARKLVQVLFLDPVQGRMELKYESALDLGLDGICDGFLKTGHGSVGSAPQLSKSCPM